MLSKQKKIKDSNSLICNAGLSIQRALIDYLLEEGKGARGIIRCGIAIYAQNLIEACEEAAEQEIEE